MQEGINALLSKETSDVLVGLAPAGTCNDFAFALGVKPDPRDIVDVLLHGDERPVDLGRAGTKYFCTIATLGFESTVNRSIRDYVTHSPPRWLPLVFSWRCSAMPWAPTEPGSAVSSCGSPRGAERRTWGAHSSG